MPGWTVYPVVPVAVYLLLLAIVWLAQDRFIYHPDRTRVDPAAADLPTVREQWLPSAEATTVLFWWAEPAREDAPVVVYFAGNAANLANRSPRFQRFVDRGWGFAALSYRGYGGSQGSPGEAANIADGLALVDWVRDRGIEPDRIVVFGESLGGAIAVQIAAQRDAAGLVLQAPFDSAVSLARSLVPWLLPGLLLRDRYDSQDYIDQIDMPLLWVHGTDDEVVPLRHGRALYDAAESPKTEAVLEGRRHNDLFDADLFDRVYAPFVERVTRDAASGL